VSISSQALALRKKVPDGNMRKEEEEEEEEGHDSEIDELLKSPQVKAMPSLPHVPISLVR
jgi:hypothetical protein